MKGEGAAWLAKSVRAWMPRGRVAGGGGRDPRQTSTTGSTSSMRIRLLMRPFDS